jgi:hypothetical protein
MISKIKTDSTTKIHQYNKINGTIKTHLVKICSQVPNYIQSSFKYGSEVWVLSKKEFEKN